MSGLQKLGYVLQCNEVLWMYVIDAIYILDIEIPFKGVGIILSWNWRVFLGLTYFELGRT